MKKLLFVLLMASSLLAQATTQNSQLKIKTPQNFNEVENEVISEEAILNEANYPTEEREDKINLKASATRAHQLDDSEAPYYVDEMENDSQLANVIDTANVTQPATLNEDDF